jgi:hypothetical protein
MVVVVTPATTWQTSSDSFSARGFHHDRGWASPTGQEIESVLIVIGANAPKCMVRGSGGHVVAVNRWLYFEADSSIEGKEGGGPLEARQMGPSIIETHFCFLAAVFSYVRTYESLRSLK